MAQLLLLARYGSSGLAQSARLYFKKPRRPASELHAEKHNRNRFSRLEDMAFSSSSSIHGGDGVIELDSSDRGVDESSTIWRLGQQNHMCLSLIRPDFWSQVLNTFPPQPALL
ncbi:MAG TPA: hypothetical protein DCE18_14325 [Syntrophobacteraceae bacterium]|jgi:hypothetical protein|nr:hypothetical protein [Syntrophobacteraceae bacterium]HBZ57305.1 hypothetical protein [Syntrophobacteraceae bacterium]